MTHDIYVSIQALDHQNDLARGHRSTGILLEPDLIFVPNFPSSLANEASMYEVLLVPLGASRRPAGPSERLSILHTEVHGLEGGDSFAGIVRLTCPSRFDPPPLRSLQSGELVDVISRNEGNMWSALSDLGLPDDNRHIDPLELLGNVDDVIAVFPDVNVVIHDSFKWMGISICKVLRRCEESPSSETSVRLAGVRPPGAS